MLPLTEREVAVIQGFADGKTYRDVGKDLGLSMSAIQAIAVRAYAKLGVRYQAHAVAEAFRTGVLTDSRAAAERDWLLTYATPQVRAEFEELKEVIGDAAS